MHTRSPTGILFQLVWHTHCANCNRPPAIALLSVLLWLLPTKTCSFQGDCSHPQPPVLQLSPLLRLGMCTVSLSHYMRAQLGIPTYPCHGKSRKITDNPGNGFRGKSRIIMENHGESQIRFD